MASPRLSLRRLARPLLAVALGAVALAQVGVADAATVTGGSGRVGIITLPDTAPSPGVTCRFVRPLFGPDLSPQLSTIILRGPTVRPILPPPHDDGLIVPALASVDFQVRQPVLIHGDPAGARLVLSAVHQVLTTSSPAGVAVPDHTFDASRLPVGRYTAQVVVTYKSTDQRVTYGAQVIRYDFYNRTLKEFSLGRFIERVVGVGASC
jgi:hypothetical protein